MRDWDKKKMVFRMKLYFIKIMLEPEIFIHSATHELNFFSPVLDHFPDMIFFFFIQAFVFYFFVFRRGRPTNKYKIGGSRFEKR